MPTTLLLCPFVQTLSIVAHWSLWLVHNSDALRSRTPWRSILGSDHQSPLWDGGYHSWLQNTGSRGGREPTEGQRNKHMNGALVDRVLASVTDRGGSFGSLCCTYVIKSIQKNPGSYAKLTIFLVRFCYLQLVSWANVFTSEPVNSSIKQENNPYFVVCPWTIYNISLAFLDCNIGFALWVSCKDQMK